MIYIYYKGLEMFCLCIIEKNKICICNYNYFLFWGGIYFIVINMDYLKE